MNFFVFQPEHEHDANEMRHVDMQCEDPPRGDQQRHPGRQGRILFDFSLTRLNRLGKQLKKTEDLWQVNRFFDVICGLRTQVAL